MDEEYKVVIFEGSKQTVVAERALKEANFDTRSIPCPRWLSLNCGIVLLIKENDREKVLEELESRGIEYEDVKPLKPPE